METQIVVGFHSIYHALKKRSAVKLLFTKDGLKDFKKLYSDFSADVDIQTFDKHQFQEEAKKIYKDHGFEFKRIPSGGLLVSSVLTLGGPAELYSAIESGPKKLIALDGVTDIHNAAAIVRTCAFFGIDGLIISGKQTFGMSPGFFRIASGGAEHVRIYQVQNLARTISKMAELGSNIYALSEHAAPLDKTSGALENFCLIMGQEDRGISNAVMRVCDNQIALPSLGNIKSLNVSVATALAIREFI